MRSSASRVSSFARSQHHQSVLRRHVDQSSVSMLPATRMQPLRRHRLHSTLPPPSQSLPQEEISLSSIAKNTASGSYNFVVRFRRLIADILLWLICGSLAMELKALRADKLEHMKTTEAIERKLRAEIETIRSATAQLQLEKNGGGGHGKRETGSWIGWTLFSSPAKGTTETSEIAISPPPAELHDDGGDSASQPAAVPPKFYLY